MNHLGLVDAGHDGLRVGTRDLRPEGQRRTDDELEELFGRRVHLFLFVKVREDWAENSEHYKEIGLDYPKE